MKDRGILKYCLDSFAEAGADKSQAVLNRTKKYELNLEAGEITLLRTTYNTDLSLTVIDHGKKGSIKVNKADNESIDEAIKNAIELSKTSEVDDSYDISYEQEPKEFTSGDSEPDLDKMHSVLKEFVDSVKELYPQIILNTVLEFKHNVRNFANSNGVNYKSSKGIYNVLLLFSSKEGEKSSSFNYSEISLKDLERELLHSGPIKYLLKQSVEQLNTTPIEGKFVGDIIITPDCLKNMLDFYTNISVRDNALISGTSLFKEKMNQQVAGSKFTLHSNPVSEEICNGYFITPDGFEAKNLTIIEDGTLKSFLLSQYGANKTKLERSKNIGGTYIVEAGDKGLQDIIKTVDRGIILSRYSGGIPSVNGDFSGVAKNSYYIENGEIKYPISETMVAGNLYDMFKNIEGISKERINFGDAILPWVCSGGITISGK